MDIYSIFTVAWNCKKELYDLGKRRNGPISFATTFFKIAYPEIQVATNSNEERGEFLE